MYAYCPLGINWEFDDFVSFTGDKFEKLIALIFERSDSFSLTVVRWLDGKNVELEKALEPYKMKQFVTPTWYGYYAGDLSIDELPSKEIYLYEANEDTNTILLNHIDDLFLNKMENGTFVEQELSLEDINFFKDETWVLGTVSHEMIATLYNTDGSFDALMKEIGNWKEIKNTASLKISDFVS
ncbi:MAG: hypothetical protein IJ711_09425 [Lachnospiraceae bacterium]|nr:hypothetical protein [Lachnospiraceae bacterium]